jgi:CRISPR-associated protein Cas1
VEYRNIFLENPARLSVQRNQLVIEQGEKYTIPIEDISALLIESQQATLTAHTAASLAKYGVTVFLCDEKHLPNCQILPINQFCRQRKLLMAQCAISKPLQKQLWQKIVIRKIQNQAECLRLMHRDGAEQLRQLANSVRSDDNDNREAVAAAM